MAEKTSRTFTLNFRILNQAAADMRGILSAFAPALGRLGNLFGTFGKNAVNALSNVGSVGGAIFLGLALAIGAATTALIGLIAVMKKYIDLLKESVRVGMQYERSMILVEAITGKATEELEKAAKSVAALGISAVQGAKGLETLARAGLPGDQLVGLFEKLTVFSRAFGVTMSKSAQLVINAMNAFQKPASDANDILRAFSYAVVKTTFDFQTFSTAWAFASAAAAGFNRDLDETVVLMGLFKDAGLRASTVGTTIRNMLTRLAKPTKQAQVEMARLGVNLDNITDKSNSWADILRRLMPLQNDLAAATALFGRRTAGFIVNLLKQLDKAGEGVADFEKKVNDLRDSGQIIRDAITKRLNTATGQIEAAIASFENLKLQFFDINKADIKGIFQEVNDAIDSISKTLKNSAPEIRLFTRAIWQLGKVFLGLLKVLFDVGDALLESFELTFLQGSKGYDKHLKNLEQQGKSTTRLGKILNFFSKGATGAARALGLMSGGMDWFLASMGNSVPAARRMRKSMKTVRDEVDKFKSLWLGMRVEKGGGVADFFGGEVDTTQIDKMIGETKKALKKAGLGEGLVDAIKPTGARVEKFAGELILKMKEGLQGNTQELVKTSVDIAKRFGIPMQKQFREAAEVFIASAKAGLSPAEQKDIRNRIIALWKGLTATLKSQESLLGPLFGRTPAQRKEVLKNVQYLTKDMQDALLRLSRTGKGQDILIQALIGGKELSAEEKRVVTEKARAAFATMAEQLDKAGKFKPGAMAAFQTILESLGSEINTINSKLTQLKNATDAVQRSWSAFGDTVGKEVMVSLEAARDTLPSATFLKLASAMEKAGNKAAAVRTQLDVLGDTAATKLRDALTEAGKGLDPQKVGTLVTQIKELIKVYNAAKNNSSKLGESTKFLNVTWADLATKLQGSTIPEIINALKALKATTDQQIQNKKAFDEWVKSLGMLTPMVKKEIDFWKKEFGNVPPEIRKLIEELLLADKAIQTSLDDAQKASMERARAWKAAAQEMGPFAAQMATSFFGLMKTMSESIGRSLVDDTFDFRDAMRKAIKDIIAQLIALAIQITILKPLLGGLFGGAGGGLFESVFGFFQHGSSMRGVAGPGGVDNVPARLTRGEIVLDNNASDIFRELVAAGGGLGGGTNMTFNINAIDGQSVKRVTRRDIIPEINNGLRSNTGISAATSIRANRLNRRRSR